MRNLPRHFNTKVDFMNIINNHPESASSARVWLRAMVDGRFAWFRGAELDSADPGIVDDTHLVEEGDREGASIRVQLELKEDPNAILYRIGFALSEAQSLLEAQ